MDELNLITFNDDNHAERVWLNGKYVGTANFIGAIISNSINIIKDLNDTYNLIETNIYACDDFDEEDEEIVDYIWQFFDEVEQMTEKQIELIKDRNWKELRKII